MNNDIDIQVLLNGNVLQAKGLARFSYITSSSAKQYLIYTLNEKTIRDDKELTKIYVSETNDAQGYQFQPINPEEWEELKKIMNQLRQPDAQVPTNVQIATLKPTQYTVGEYKKIGVDDEFCSYLLANQVANEPKDETIIPPSGSNTQFFDPAVVQDIDAVQQSQDVPAVPDAFSMSAPVQQPAAPAAPVPAQPVQQPVEAVQQPAQPVQVQGVQAIETQASVADVAPVAPVAPAQTEIVQEVTPVAETQIVNTIEQPVGDAIPTPVPVENTIVEQPVEATPQPIEMPQPVEVPQAIETPTPVEVTPVETPTPVTPTIDNNTNVPQDVIDGFKKFLDYVGADMNKVNEVLKVNGVPEMQTTPSTQEESVEVTPVTTTAIDINNLPVVEQEPVGEEEPLVEEPIVPGAPSLPVDDMVSTPQVEENAYDMGTPSYVASTNTDVVPQAPVAEAPAPVADIAPVADVAPVTPAAPEPIQPVDAAPQVEAPQVQPDLMAPPTIEPLPDVSTPEIQQPANIDTSFLDAGPVVMPVGQEAVSSQGLPGDSGAKTLDLVA